MEGGEEEGSMYDRGINLVSEETAGRKLPGFSKVKGTTEGNNEKES